MSDKSLLSKTIDRRRFLKTSAGAAAAGAAASVLGAPFVHAKTKEIRFLNTETSLDSIRAMKVAGAAYEKKTGVRVVIDSSPLGDAFTKITTSLKGGKPYDIGTLGFVGHVLLLAGEGKLVPLNDLIKSYKWGPNILFPIKGDNYWYPYDYNFAWLYYRKDLYKAKGLKEPGNWDELVANAEALKTDDMAGAVLPIGSNSATSWLSFGCMWAEGVKLVDDNWKVVLDSDGIAGKAAAYLDFFARYYKTMAPGAIQASFGQMINLFATGKTAHSAYAGRMIESLERNALDLATKYGMMPYMNSDGTRRAVNHGYDGWVVLDTPNAEESLKFLKWFGEEQYINFLHTAPLHFQPARLDVYDDIRWRAHPLIEKHKEAITRMQGFLSDPAMTITSIDTQGPEVDLRGGKLFESYALPEMLQNKLLKGMSSQDCVRQAADKLRKVLS